MKPRLMWRRNADHTTTATSPSVLAILQSQLLLLGASLRPDNEDFGDDWLEDLPLGNDDR